MSFTPEQPSDLSLPSEIKKVAIETIDEICQELSNTKITSEILLRNVDWLLKNDKAAFSDPELIHRLFAMSTLDSLLPNASNHITAAEQRGAHHCTTCCDAKDAMCADPVGPRGDVLPQVPVTTSNTGHRPLPVDVENLTQVAELHHGVGYFRDPHKPLYPLVLLPGSGIVPTVDHLPIGDRQIRDFAVIVGAAARFQPIASNSCAGCGSRLRSTNYEHRFVCAVCPGTFCVKCFTEIKYNSAQQKHNALHPFYYLDNGFQDLTTVDVYPVRITLSLVGVAKPMRGALLEESCHKCYKSTSGCRYVCSSCYYYRLCSRCHKDEVSQDIHKDRSVVGFPHHDVTHIFLRFDNYHYEPIRSDPLKTTDDVAECMRSISCKIVFGD